jgi:hypothetical protein
MTFDRSKLIYISPQFSYLMRLSLRQAQFRGEMRNRNLHQRRVLRFKRKLKLLSS